MTTIACDGKSMAGDSLVTCNNEIVGFNPGKVQKTGGGRLFGSCGSSADCALFARWMHSDEYGSTTNPELTDDFSAIVLETDGKLFYYCKKLVPVEFILPQAIGSGADFAIGAMLAGKSAEEAVAIAITRDTGSGGAITVERVCAEIDLAA